MAITELDMEMLNAVIEHVLVPRVAQLTEKQKARFAEMFKPSQFGNFDTIKRACILCDKSIEKNNASPK
jgi:hypothetical protein